MTCRSLSRRRCGGWSFGDLSKELLMASAKWPFDDPPNVATITVRQVIHDGEPILLVARDADDGGWQFLAGGEFDVDDGMVVSLRSILERDSTIAELVDLKPGWQATRETVGAPWKRSEQSEE
jgi:hypothetical protein